MTNRFSRAFALPTILIASVVMLMVLLVAVQAVVSISEGLRGQYDEKLANEAAASGVAMAKACIKASNSVQWANNRPLRPNTACNGSSTVACPAASDDASCSVLTTSTYRTTYEVKLVYDNSNNPISVVSTGYARQIRKTSGDVLKQANATQTFELTNFPNLSKGLIGWWKLNGNANDSSGNNYNGTINGATLTTGQKGLANTAYSFNGSSSYISIPTISVWHSVSVSAWIYSANFGHNGFIIGKNPVNEQWEIFFETTNLRWRAGAPYVNTTACSLPTNGVWHHVVGTQSGTVASLYIDGVRCSYDTAQNPIGNGTGAVEIGRFGSPGYYYYNGVIDDVRLYNRVLTQDDVSALTAAGAQ